MNHVVVSERWRCRMCGRRLWLFFAPSGCDEDGHCDGSDCDAVFCPGGHQVPADMGEQVCDNADVEFQEALDSGLHMGEVWMTGEDRPPRAAGCIRPASILRWSFLSLLWCFLTGCVWTALLPPDGVPGPHTVIVSFFVAAMAGLVFLRAGRAMSRRRAARDGKWA